MMLARSQVALGILAGGQARRLGGIDKALAHYQGQPLAHRTLAALGEGYAEAIISYNGSGGVQLPAGARCVADARPGSAGPLAGIEALLSACSSTWLLTVPVDLARVPEDLFERLAACAADGTCVRAHDADGEQPLVALWPLPRSRGAANAALDAGENAVHRLQSLLGFESCDFSPWRFGNLNTPEDFAHEC
jgi:molybdopterin-guanine dinucleotide biosynthesis protein A